jgi:hypothetical protein
VDRVAASARQVYQLHGKADRLIVEHPEADHDFPDASRERAYSFILKGLR